MEQIKFGILVLNVLLIAQVISFTQSDHAIIKKIFERYQSNQTIDYDLTYYYFPTLDAERATDSLVMSIIQKGKQIYMSMDEMEILQLGQQNLMVDHTYRQMLLQSIPSQVGPSLEHIIASATDLNLRVEDIKLNANTNIVRMTAPNDSKTIIELHYHPKTYFLKRILLQIENEAEWNTSAYNNTKVVAIYSKHGVNRKKLPTDLSKYLKKEQGRYLPQLAYKSYEVSVQ